MPPSMDSTAPMALLEHHHTMDSNTSPRCPDRITVPQRARVTPQTMPQSFHLPKIAPFPNDDILSIAQTLETPPTPLPKPENKNLKVFLQIRPLLSSPVQAPRKRPKSAWPQNPVKNNAPPGAKISKNKNPTTCLTVNDSQSMKLSTPVSSTKPKRIKSKTYGGFSRVFSSDSSQFQVYERMMKPLVEEFLRGRSGMLAAIANGLHKKTISFGAKNALIFYPGGTFAANFPISIFFITQHHENKVFLMG